MNEGLLTSAREYGVAVVLASDVRKGWFLNGEGVSANLPAAAQTYITGKKAPAYTQVKYGVLNDQWGTDNNATDIILMRVEEMYLIKAEAKL